MRKDRPSRTALKVALAVVTLGAKPGMEDLLPPGIVQASQEVLLASGVVGPGTIRWAGSSRAVSVYEAFDWMLPGQFEAFANRFSIRIESIRADNGVYVTKVFS